MEGLQIEIDEPLYFIHQHWLEDDGFPFQNPKEKAEEEMYMEWLFNNEEEN